MAPSNSSKAKKAAVEAVSDAPVEAVPAETVPVKEAEVVAEPVAEAPIDTDGLDTVFTALKTLLTTVDKLQKSRQDVGDIKPLLIRLLDGELLSGDELDQLKSGVSGLSKLVKFYGDYQVALEKAQPARDMLDTVLK